MALHDYQCPTCGHRAVDVNVPIEIGAAAVCVECPLCADVGRKSRMEWLPQVGRMDAGNGPSFVAFDTFDGKNQKVHVSSLKQLRDIERQSEVDHRNGEGQPLVFRTFSNDPSNKDQSALHPNFAGGEQPTTAAKSKFGATLQKAADAPEAEFGPGVNESNASALGGD